jgi:hypothetical protein
MGFNQGGDPYDLFPGTHTWGEVRLEPGGVFARDVAYVVT